MAYISTPMDPAVPSERKYDWVWRRFGGEPYLLRQWAWIHGANLLMVKVAFVVYIQTLKTIRCAHPPQGARQIGGSHRPPNRALQDSPRPHGSKAMGDTCWSAVWLCLYTTGWLVLRNTIGFSIPTLKWWISQWAFGVGFGAHTMTSYDL